MSILFPGTFDPFTIGHADLVRRALSLTDHVIVAVGVNTSKAPFRSPEQRVEDIRRAFADEPRVSVITYADLTVDCARRLGATAILRGVRSTKDYEYERDIADVNRQIGGIDTILLFADPSFSAISSSMVRELAAFGKDITPYLP